MNKIIYLFIALFAISSCKDVEPDIYTNENLLNFNKGVTANAAVPIESTSKNFTISYGVIKPVSGNHQVKLVADPSSEVVAGTDYEILNGATDELTVGEDGGTFTIKVNKTNLTTTSKKLVFKLQSSTIQNAIFDQIFTLNLSLKCDLTAFFSGPFNNNAGWWNTATPQTFGGQFLIETNPSSPGKLFVRDFLDIGRDLVVSYNTAETEFTVDNQFTGSSTTYQGIVREIWVMQRAGTTNTVSACGRTMKLMTYYYLKDGNAAYGGDTSESFTGF